MKTQKKTKMIGLIVMFVLAGMICPTGRVLAGELRGSFVRLTELRVQERGFMGIVIKPLERGELQTIVVPRQSERLVQAARRLRAGQKVEIVYAEEAGHKWVERLEAEATCNSPWAAECRLESMTTCGMARGLSRPWREECGDGVRAGDLVRTGDGVNDGRL